MLLSLQKYVLAVNFCIFGINFSTLNADFGKRLAGDLV